MTAPSLPYGEPPTQLPDGAPSTPPAPDLGSDPVVAAALRPLAGAAGASPEDQLGVYSDVHVALQAALDAEMA